MKSSDLFIKQLQEEGVEYIFGLPGEENLDLLESIRTSNIKLIVTRHEQAAAFMAATYGRLTGKAGVCLSTLGPGATNLVTGIAHSQLTGAPMVSISGQKAIKGNWQAMFQIIDVVSLMRPITKKSVSIVDPDTIPNVLRDAFKIAESERPGAVHVELPEDVAREQTESKVQKKTIIRRPSPDHKAIDRAVEMINKSKSPLIMISSGANRKLITKALKTLMDSTGIFAVHTQMGKGVIPDDCNCSLFATGIHREDYVYCGINKSDLLITIGYDLAEYPPSLWNKKMDKKIINIDFVPSSTDKFFNPSHEVIGDISHSLRRIAETIKNRREFPRYSRLRETIKKKIDEKHPASYPLNPPTIVKGVRNALGKEDILTFDNGIYKLWFSRFYKTYHPNTFLLDNAFATMGAGLPAAMAAKLLNPAKKVLAVVGDGGFMMNSQEIETALRYKLNVVILVLNDNAFGFIKWKQSDRGYKEFGIDYSNPDFVAYAKSFGAKGIKVNKGDQLEKVLSKAFSLKTTVIVECPIDYAMNYEVFSKELKNLTCTI